ncbi:MULTISPECIES: tRNA adenosine(34) deaminase TadA [Caproicibacterium]|jgi:tRNA(adenine34) deaminase|uniref:tRNA-specific adenosine deaminase n=1 Tax=Caproicibacterium lactatifermentans TaxID=2666138 RepID=A0A859DXV9_9FIRM|nr:tRNA adenosine(34) deaminase TadA [Caproicibacterium lactatifermentans]ARP51150.1 tRNA-specific adenosine deaminase [Ruminococcaceae bacterium CPB6]MDD4807809.1 tRNA adenosine(34) deaminase TadA [Oscillospiraceae bacterium]QKN24831.1 tRNA-specific adenosine deaminase [Caproicibacterium lactatifermentans]QKO31171.1 tRNA-specific adenosine deaminase [Caproicibacterium lactatifermentans]
MTDEECMRRALQLAQEAADEGEVPVGAVLTKDGEIIAEGKNRRETGKNALYHAELAAIDKGCRVLGGWRLWQCTLYVTLEPCPMCAGAIINARIPRLVYGAKDPKTGSCGSVIDLFSCPYNHHPKVEQGLLGEECAEVLRGFFRCMRAARKEKKAGKQWKTENKGH